MEQIKKRIISISDIVSWLYCPRKLFLTKVKRIQQPLTKEMLVGKIRHSILENFSKNEEELVSNIDKDYEKLDLILIYENFIREVAEKVFENNKNALLAFKVDKEEVLKKVLRGFLEDIRIRVENLNLKLKQGLFGKELWKNLDNIYISEVSLESENLGLRGRVDRIQVSRLDKKIIPFELKSRDERIFHSDEIQLTAYAMLLEDHYKTKIEKGFIESGTAKQELEIKEEDRNEVMSIADEIRNLQENYPPKMLSNFNKCKSCSMNEICPEL